MPELGLVDKIEILEDFNEGCELTDAVNSLLSAAGTLMSYGTLLQVESIISIVEALIDDYITFIESQGDEEAYEWYLDISDKVYRCLYTRNKLSKEEFLA